MQSDLLVGFLIILGAALVGGLLMSRLGQPVIIGYLLGGVAIGPHGLALVREVGTVQVIATIGVILLMFALGVEFSLKSLKEAGKIGLGGGLLQIGGTTALGFLAIFYLLDRSLSEAIFFGYAIAMTSTAVLLKILMERGEIQTIHGRISLSISLVQDLSVVPVMTVIPTLGAAGGSLLPALGLAIGKALGFLAGMLLLGLWLIPKLLGRVAGLRSRELFLLTVITLVLGAGAAAFFVGISVALGAFLAGLIVSESEYGHQALADIIPLRDSFAAVFFVSLGMLTDPMVAISNWPMILMLVVIILVSKFLVMSLISWFFGYSAKTSMYSGAAIIPVGEFSFILAIVGLEAGVISQELYQYILGSAIITIMITPFALKLVAYGYGKVSQRERLLPLVTRHVDTPLLERRVSLSNHVVICGHGRVGRHLAEVLESRELPYMVIDLDPGVIADLSKKGVPAIYGDAANLQVLKLADLGRARVLVITAPDPQTINLAVSHARRLNPRLDIIVRVHFGGQAEELKSLGVAEVVQPEFEAGLEIIRHTLHRYGLGSTEIQYIISAIRQRGLGPS